MNRIVSPAMDITDARTVVDFQTTTFCGHLRSHVVKVLLQTIQLGHADYACYWSLELLCSGLTHTLWLTLFEAAALHVNRAAPNMVPYLETMYERYAPLEAALPVHRMTELRNNPDVRTIICTVAATLALARKTKLPSLPTLKPAHDFDPVTIQESLKAPSALYGRVVLRRDDPASMAIPINEMCYCLRQDIRDVTRTLYWMSWIHAYARELKKQTKQPLVCANRTDAFVSVAHGTHLIWLLWDCVRAQASPLTRSYVNALYRMYCLRWSPSDAKGRQSLLIAAVVITCDGPSLDMTVVSGDTAAVSSVISGIPGWIDAITRMQKSFSSEGTK
jgi:hypothetical protein